MLPVGKPRHDHLVELGQQRAERLRALRRRSGKLSPHLAGTDGFTHRPLPQTGQVVGNPVHERMPVRSESVQVSERRIVPVIRLFGIRLVGI